MAKHLQTFRGVDNASLMNAIRKNASNQYMDRVPNTTKATVAQTAEQLMNYQNDRNEFIDALINQVGKIEARTFSWSNPLTQYKGGMLPWGSTFEEYMVGIVPAYVYDERRQYLEGDIFGQHQIEAQSSFHTINRKEFYPLTVNRDVLRRAFLEPEGLSSLVGQLMQAVTNSDQIDEFNIMCNLFNLYEENEGFFKINIPNVAAFGSTMADVKFALRRMHEARYELSYPSRRYNAAGMTSAIQNDDDLVLFCRPGFKAAIDVEALASLFNVAAADVPFRITVLPDERWEHTDIQAILTSKHFFQVMDTLLENTNAENPVGLYHNYFYHHQGIYSFSRFVPAIAFTTGAGTEITVTPTPVTGIQVPKFVDTDGNVVTELKRGAYYGIVNPDKTQLVATTTPPNGTNNAVRIEADILRSDFSVLTQNGTLLIAQDELSPEVTFKFIAVDDEKVTRSVKLKITGDVLRVWPDPKVSPAPEATP